MARKFYLDTSIWRDYFEDRKDNIRPLGKFAFQFLKNCGKAGCIVLYSDLVVQELKSDYSNERIAEVFSSFRHFLLEAPISNERISEARKIASSVEGTHLKDALHAILARDNCAVMVARDKHFDALTHLVEVAKPEDIFF
ncbi:hypothetical protein HZB89_02130 [archaeon]|nr:hypothetical protein [archaeon]